MPSPTMATNRPPGSRRSRACSICCAPYLVLFFPCIRPAVAENGGFITITVGLHLFGRTLFIMLCVFRKHLIESKRLEKFRASRAEFIHNHLRPGILGKHGYATNPSTRFHHNIILGNVCGPIHYIGMSGRRRELLKLVLFCGPLGLRGKSVFILVFNPTTIPMAVLASLFGLYVDALEAIYLLTPNSIAS